MSTQLVKLLAPAVVFLAAGTASAGHGGGGHGSGHSGGHHGGSHTVHHSGSYRSYSSYGYGGYGYGLGYGYGGYSYPYSGYSYPAGGYYSPNSYYIVPAGDYSVDPMPAPSAVAAPATVTVIVPEGAQVWFDGKDAVGTGTERVFTSLALQPNQPSVLSVKASWGGSTYSMQLTIHAGDKRRVDLR
jgi:uncharacterized protein (TIGR03000 family)